MEKEEEYFSPREREPSPEASSSDEERRRHRHGRHRSRRGHRRRSFSPLLGREQLAKPFPPNLWSVPPLRR